MGDGVLPAVVEVLALFFAEVRREAGVFLPEGGELFRILPYPGGKACHVGGAERRRLALDGAAHGKAEDARLHLHEQIVAACAARYAKLLDGKSRVRANRLVDVAHLVCHGGERRANEMGAARVLGKPDEHAARLAVPIGSGKAAESGNEVDARRVRDALGDPFGRFERVEDLESAPQPFECDACHEDAAFERVSDMIAELPCDGGVESVVRLHITIARVEEEEGAFPISVLRRAGCEAALAEEVGLLVAEDAADGDLRAEYSGRGHAVFIGGWMNLGHKGARNLRLLQQRVVPRAVREVVEHRARRIRIVCRMNLAACELPEEPAVDRAEGEVALFCQSTRTGHVVEEPADLADGKIWRENHRRVLAELLQKIGVFAEAFDDLLRLHRLPADGMMDRPSRMAVPEDGRLALVRDADRRDFRLLDAGFPDRLLCRPKLCRPDLVRILFDPAGLWAVDVQLLRREGDEIRPLVKNRRAVFHRARIKCEDVSPAHEKAPFRLLPYRHYIIGRGLCVCCERKRRMGNIFSCVSYASSFFSFCSARRLTTAA